MEGAFPIQTVMGYNHVRVRPGVSACSEDLFSTVFILEGEGVRVKWVSVQFLWALRALGLPDRHPVVWPPLLPHSSFLVRLSAQTRCQEQKGGVYCGTSGGCGIGDWWGGGVGSHRGPGKSSFPSAPFRSLWFHLTLWVAGRFRRLFLSY